MNTACKLLLKNFERQKKISKGLSLRSLAADVGVSPGYLSKVFSEKRALTSSLALKLCKRLRVDDLQLDQIMSSLKKDLIESNFGKNESASFGSRKSVKMLDEMVLMEPQVEWLLEHWYRLAILDLITCDNFKLDIDWMAQRLDLNPKTVAEAISQLLENGLIKKDKQGSVAKTYEKLRFPAKYSKEIIRKYHEAQMKRAIDCMNSNVTQKDFDQRLIIGISVASNLENLEKAKELIHRTMYEVAELLSSGSCTEVYHLGIQLFPQTR